MNAPASSSEFAATAAVTVQGNGDTVALLLHGLGGDRHQPWSLLRGDTYSGLTLVAPDQRAHGETPVIGEPEDFTLDGLADDVAALLHGRGLDRRPLIVGGISMGAAVALRLLQRGEHDFRGGLLIRPAFGSTPWPEHLRVFRDIASLLRSDGASGRDAFLQSDRYQRVADVSAIGANSLLAQFSKPESEARVVRLENVPANASITWNDNWSPPCPVTIVGADEDPVHPLAVAQLWHERIVNTGLVVLPSRDRKPDQFDAALTETTRKCLEAWT